MINENNTQTAIRQANTSLINKTRKTGDGKQELGKEDFLNLLMAQVTHQDPLNPMDSQSMMDQLTQMGSLEQLITLNKQMGEINESQREIVKLSAYSFLDKDITVKGGRAEVIGGITQNLQFNLTREATEVKLFITDQDGNQVRRMELGQMAPGQHYISWDSKDNQNDMVLDGSYRYSVIASNAENQAIPVALLMRGKVSGVKFVEGRPQLIMNGDQIDLKDVFEISNASERIFSNREPQPIHNEMRPKPLADNEDY